MDIPFRMRLEVDEQGVCRNDRCIQMRIERFVINQLSECALLRTYISDEIVDTIHGIIHALHSSCEIRLFEVSDDGVEVRNSRIGIVDDRRHLVIHHFLEFGRNASQISRNLINIRKGILEMVALYLSAQFRHERVNILNSLANSSPCNDSTRPGT